MPTHTPPQLPGAVVIRPTPVAQGLPDVESTVLLFLSDGHTCEGYYDGTHWRDSTAWPIEGATVQAWADMPTMETLQPAPALAADLMAAGEYLRMDSATLDSAEALRLAWVLAQLAGRQAAVAPPTADRISAALAAPGCERLRDFYDTGPAQRASVETFAGALGVAPAAPWLVEAAKHAYEATTNASGVEARTAHIRQVPGCAAFLRVAADERRYTTQCKKFDNNCGAVHPSNCPDCPFRTDGVKTVDGGRG